MFRYLIFLTLLIGAFASVTEIQKLKGDVLIVNSVDEAIKLFPEATLIPLERNDLTKGTLQYTLGNRVSGDRLVAQGSDSYQWATPQNIELKLQYPNSGTGAVVTHVNVIIQQTGDAGRGYVLSGGIGQRFILVVIEAYSTYYVDYTAAIYGL